MAVHSDQLQIAKYKVIIRQYLSKDEIKQLHEKSDIKGAIEVLTVWGWIALAFAMVYFYPHPVTIIPAMFILAGKQLGCAIIMHDTSHHSLFKRARLNHYVGNWLGAYPIFQNLEQYRPYHLQHHVLTGTEDDPDILLTSGYPTSRSSLIRKFLRDLTGITGLKALLGVLLMHIGYLRYNLGNKVERTDAVTHSLKYVLSNFWQHLKGPVIFHMLFFLLFYSLGRPYLYFLWWAAYLTTYNFVLRVRSIAEHSLVEDTTNPLRNTRTTYANFLERLLFAPLHVNYHLEHHLLIAAPCYNYPKLHQMLKQRGLYETALLESDYLSVLKKTIISKDAAL